MEDGVFTLEFKDGHLTKSKLEMEKFTIANGLLKYVNSMEITTIKSAKALTLAIAADKFDKSSFTAY